MLKVAINISPVQLSNKNFVSSFKRLIRKFGIDYKKIKLEITETQILRNEKRIIRSNNRINYQYGKEGELQNSSRRCRN
ncbi:MAG: hypothetical protein PWP21_1675 [Thermosediminibacterales bacterium]|nr:hypothetical protein [Thermosediminibacterales bacterium]